MWWWPVQWRCLWCVDSEQKSTPGTSKKPSGSSSKAGGKKGQRKDDEWEEVSRK